MFNPQEKYSYTIDFKSTNFSASNSRLLHDGTFFYYSTTPQNEYQQHILK